MAHGPLFGCCRAKAAGNASDNFEIDIQEGGMKDGSANPNDVLAGSSA